MSDYVWILIFINLMMFFFFCLFFWWSVKAGQEAVQDEVEAGPPPYNTLQDCENPPAYDSIFVHKPPSIIWYTTIYTFWYSDSEFHTIYFPQCATNFICVPQVPQMWHKMWHNWFSTNHSQNINNLNSKKGSTFHQEW